jgi:hypothetical protein
MHSSAHHFEGNKTATSARTQEVNTNSSSVLGLTDSRKHSNAVEPAIDALPGENSIIAAQAGWGQWFKAFKQVLPIYISAHLAFLILTYLAALFTIGNFSTNVLRIHTMLDVWHRWDSEHFAQIATNGYDRWWRTAFFPLFPFLEKGLAVFTSDPFVAGLIIANLAGLAMLVVLYRLVEEEFNGEQAFRTTLYLTAFPTAFFFAAAYNESLFLFLTLLSFYHMRRRNWWIAGLFGFLASLTRSAGICLFLPFCYEYLRQHQFQLKRLRFDSISSLGILAGLGVFAAYCSLRFHDFLAFAHAQVLWKRHFHEPWYGFIDSLTIILHRRVLSFDSIHNAIDLSACMFLLLLVVLCFLGPWKFPKAYVVYGFYAGLVYLFSIIMPTDGSVPLAAFSRYMLEIFPAFIVLAAIGKKPQLHLYYLMLSVPILSCMLLQFLTGHWII